MSLEVLTDVEAAEPIQVNLDNDELVVIETLQYGAYDAVNVSPNVGGACCNCNSNSNSNGSSEDPIG